VTGERPPTAAEFIRTQLRLKAAERAARARELEG